MLWGAKGGGITPTLIRTAGFVVWNETEPWCLSRSSMSVMSSIWMAVTRDEGRRENQRHMNVQASPIEWQSVKP